MINPELKTYTIFEHDNKNEVFQHMTKTQVIKLQSKYKLNI